MAQENQIITSQIKLGDSILRVTDSIVISLTSLEYFNLLLKDSTSYITEMTDGTNTYKSYSVSYWLKNRTKSFRNLHTINYLGDLGPAKFSIPIETTLGLNTTRFIRAKQKIEKQFIAYKRYLNADFIPLENAKKIAEEYFIPNSNAQFSDYYFIYNTINDKFYWRINKYKGYGIDTIQEIDINAETSVIENNETIIIHRENQNN